MLTYFKGLTWRWNIYNKRTPCVSSLMCCLTPNVFWNLILLLWCHLKLMACASQSSYLSFMVFACLTEQNSKLVDLKLKKLLEAQPQVANSLSSASQKAATDISEQKVSLALGSCPSCFSLENCCFMRLMQFEGIWNCSWTLILLRGILPREF